jgi:purine-binding chemotaxis protein CheW
MENQSLLVFSLNGLLVAVDGFAVSEILWLMEITPLEEAPSYIIGAINLRGKIIPVMDLNLRFGHEPRKYLLSNSVVVIESNQVRIGVVVDETHEVINITSADIESSPVSSLGVRMPPQFIRKVARVGDDIIMILSHENLLGDQALEEDVIIDEGLDQKPSRRYFCPEASPEERAIFRDRARNLMQASAGAGIEGLIPTAVVGLNGEYFGVDLELAQEFSNIHNLTPIPCCPGHVVGNMNLRGHVLTILDIRNLLGMAGNELAHSPKVIVVRMGDISAGVLVDDIYDIIYLNPSNIGPIPSAIQKVSERYVNGVSLYGGKAMTLLNLRNILTSEDLLVREQV